MAMSGYFTDGKPSPSVHDPPFLSDYDSRDFPAPKEPTQLPTVKNYDTIKDSKDSKYISSIYINKASTDLTLGIRFKSQLLSII